MPIVMTKQQRELTDSRQIAGDKQERDVAFYLRRAFKNNDDFFVFNDFAFSYNGENAQIDHLVLHKFGFLILESKSIHGEVSVNTSGEWSRSFNGKWTGIPSPIKQAELQLQLLKKMLIDNATEFLSKILGIQQNVGGRKWNSLCVVSNTCILHRENIPKEINDRIIKSEAVADAVKKVGGKSLIKAFIETAPAFSKEEMQHISDYLLTRVKPCSNQPIGDVDNSNQTTTETVEQSHASTEHSSSEATPVFIKCKKCGEIDKLTGCYGKYGYYVNCLSCGTNTSMRVACAQCGKFGGKVTKKKAEYWMNCECSSPYLLFVQKEPETSSKAEP